MKPHFLTFCMVLGNLLVVFAQQPVSPFLSFLNDFYSNVPQEKIFIHTDKPTYSGGETLWYQGYLVDGQTHTPDALSRVAYVSLTTPDGKKLDQKNLRVEKGIFHGDITLPEDLPSGEYMLQGFTYWMIHKTGEWVFSKPIHIINPDEGKVKSPKSEAMQVRFFPEGGYMVNGLSGLIAVKVCDEQEKGIENVTGTIVDDAGNSVGFFKSQKFGMGVLSLRPTAGTAYKAKVEWNGQVKEFALPAALTEGVVMQVNNKSPQKCGIKLSTTKTVGLDTLYLVGHIRGMPAFEQSVVMEGSSRMIEIPKTGFPTGILTITVFNALRQPVAERLVFIQTSEKQLTASIELLQDTYAPRQAVKARLQVDGLKDTLQYSVSVHDLGVAAAQGNTEHIKAYLLLRSDLKGYIEQPAYFFSDTTAQVRNYLDVLMMTHGWRRFMWQEVMQKKYIDSLAILPEIDLSLEGYISAYEKPEKPIEAEILINTFNPFGIVNMLTKEDGFFRVTGFNFRDTTSILVQAGTYKERKAKKEGLKINIEGNRFVSIHPLENTASTPETSHLEPNPGQPDDLLSAYQADIKRIQTVDSIYSQMVIDLDEMTVTETRRKQPTRFDQVNKIYGTPSRRLVIDSMPGARNLNSVMDIVRYNVPGVQVAGSFPDQYFVIRNAANFQGDIPALVLLDGTPVDVSIISTMSALDVDFIDVLKGADAAIFGMNGGGGAIAVYTRRGSNGGQLERGPGVLTYQHPGYYQAKEFFAPNYAFETVDHVKPDYRTTLFWRPALMTTTASGFIPAFYSCDKRSYYVIEVNGLQKDGTPFYASKVFTVN